MFLEGRGVQDAVEVGQVPPKMDPSWAKLGLSWHLEATLAPRWPKMAKITWKMRLQRPKMRFRRRLGGVWGGLGRVLRRLGRSGSSKVVR